MEVGRSAALTQLALIGDRLRRAGQRASDLGFLGAQRRREFAQRHAGDLQDLRRVGEPRGLDAAVGPDPRDVRRARRPVRPRAAARSARRRARRSGPDQRCLPRLHSPDLEPVRAPVARAVRGTRPQSDPAGPGPRDPSAAALSRLCRLLDRLFVRRGGSDRGPHRRGLGALRQAVHPRRLELPHAWHRRWLVLGLLHAGLGRLLVLGPGRERLPHAVARRHRLRPFGRGDGEARRAESLDDLPRHPRLLVLAARHLPRALGRAHLGPRLRQRSAPRRLHPRHSGAVHMRLVRALRLARADAQAGRAVRADLARGRAGRQQSASDHRMRDGAVRHPLSAGARATDRREDHRRRALLQPHLRRAPADRLLRRAVRLLARLEARRPLGGRAAADLRAHRSAR